MTGSTTVCMIVGILPRWRLVRTVEALTLPEKVGSVFGFSGQNVPFSCFEPRSPALYSAYSSSVTTSSLMVSCSWSINEQILHQGQRSQNWWSEILKVFVTLIFKTICSFEADATQVWCQVDNVSYCKNNQFPIFDQLYYMSNCFIKTSQSYENFTKN